MNELPKVSYSRAEVQAVTGMGPRQIINAVREGRMPGKFVGKKLIFMQDDWDRICRGDWQGDEQRPKAVESSEQAPTTVKFLQTTNTHRRSSSEQDREASA